MRQSLGRTTKSFSSLARVPYAAMFCLWCGSAVSGDVSVQRLPGGHEQEQEQAIGDKIEHR
jgi:hypothetical protein